MAAEAFARLELGRDVYGRFDPAIDTRDLFLEAELELLDSIVYAYLAILKLRAARGRVVGLPHAQEKTP